MLNLYAVNILASSSDPASLKTVCGTTRLLLSAADKMPFFAMLSRSY